MGNEIAQKTWAIWLLHTVAGKQIWLFRWLPAAQTLWGEVRTEPLLQHEYPCLLTLAHSLHQSECAEPLPGWECLAMTTPFAKQRVYL